MTNAPLAHSGVDPEDEYFHPHSPSHEWWSESYRWDWLDRRGEQAGHCRLAVHPNQRRGWLSVYVVCGGEWISIDEPRLPLEPLCPDPLRYAGWGLELRRDVAEPLHGSRLRVSGSGRVMHGRRAGAIVPLRIDLAIAGIRAPHFLGSGSVPAAKPDASGHATNRYQQLVTVRGTVRAGAEAESFEGFGARDHTWGPRSWRMEWESLSLHGPDRHVRASVTRIPNVGRFASGHIHAGSGSSVVEADFRLGRAAGHSPPLAPGAGSVAIRTHDGALFSGHIEPLSALQIDLSHTDLGALRSRCIRSWVRFVPDGPRRRRSQPLFGWLEMNQFEE